MDKSKRTIVVHLITLLELGGAQGNTIYTVKNLDPTRFKTYLWCGKGAYWDASVTSEIGGNKRLKFFPYLVRSISPIKDLRTLFLLISELRNLRPDILHTHSSKAGILGRIAGHFTGVPVIIHTFHGFGFNHKQKPWTRWIFVHLEKWCAKYSNKLIFVSESNRDEAQIKKIGQPEKYRLIRSGIPIGEIMQRGKNAPREDLLRSLGFSRQTKIVTTIGAFKPQKNLLDFVEIANRLKTELNLKFIMIGDGYLRKNIEDQIKAYNLTDKIKLLGWREDIPELLSVSNVFVMTSLWEGLPRSLVEALVLKIPAVCYQTDGVQDLLAKGGGKIIPQNRPDLAVLAISQILNENHSKSSLFSEIPYSELQEFDINTMVRQQEELYVEIFAENNLN